MDNLLRIIYWLGLFVLALSCIFSLVNWQKQFSVVGFLSFYLFLNLATEIIVYCLRGTGINNLPLLHLYTLGEFVIYSLMYLSFFKLDNKNKRLAGLLTFLVSILIILNSVFVQSIWGFNSYAKTLVQCVIIIYSLSYFFLNYMNKIKNGIIRKVRLFINATILIYYSGSLFVFMFSDYFLRVLGGTPRELWIINISLNFLFQVAILVTVWKVFNNRKSITLS